MFKNFLPSLSVLSFFCAVLLLATFYFLLSVSSAFAATAVVSIDTGGENINALEATLVLSEDMRIKEIQTGNSAILMWIIAPRQEGNSIIFAGITPGGFTGTHPIFTVSGDFNAEDLEQIRFESANALKNDGSGTNVPVELTLFLTETKDDKEPPEDFMPTVSSDLNLFDGRYFLVFATQDKGSGVNRYEVREGRWGWFRDAESPHLLKSQKLDSDIYVKAIDSAGNERTVVLKSSVHRNWWEGSGLFAILIVLVLVVVAVYKKAWARFKRY